MTSKKKILISGAGIAGLLTYIYLDRNKYEVTLIEKGDRFRSVGYVITIWNCGYDLLKRTLLSRGDYAEHFIKLEKTLMLNEATFPKSLYSFKDLGYIVDREAFLGMLITEAQKIEGRMLLNTTIAEASQGEEECLVTLSTGEKDVYDLVVVCEGINSPTREHYFEDVEIADSDYAVEYAEIERIPVLTRKNVIFNINNLTGVVMTSPESAITAHFFLTTESDYLAKRNSMRKDLETMLAQIYGPGCRPIYRDNAKVFELKEIRAPRSCAGRMVLLGDAAHGRLPVLGLGTTFATEDAFFLAELLNQLESDEWKCVKELIGEFSQVRKKRVEQLYALQDVVIKNSLPRTGRLRKTRGRLTKHVLNLFNLASNRIFILFLRRLIT